MSKILYTKVPLSKLEIILYRYKDPKVWKMLWIYIFNLLRASFKWYKVSTNSILHQKFKSKIQAKTSINHFRTLISSAVTYLDKDEWLDSYLSQHLINYESVI